MFEHFQDILCIPSATLYSDLGIVTKSNYDQLVSRKKVNLIQRGGNGRKALIEWASLPEKYKQPIIEKIGDPAKTTQYTRFMDRIERDAEAIKYFNDYVLDNGGALPDKNKKEYTTNAAVMNAIIKTAANRSQMRKALGGSARDVWKNLAEVVAGIDRGVWPHTLPKNQRRLREKCNQYKKHGYESLIHKGFCNKNSEKINSLAQMWVLSRWSNRYDRVANLAQLLQEYNEYAISQDWKPLKSEQSLYDFLQKPDVRPMWYTHRYGSSVAKEKFIYQHSTKMPTMRDSLWYSDGTKLNYYYQYANADGKIKIGTCQVYEVMDAFSEVFLGYHISDSENFEAQFAAYKMAMQMAGHRPYQIGFDGQGGHKKLGAGNFFSKLTNLAIRTQPYNGKSKTIESAFGRFQTQFMKKDWFFTGQNIQSKKLESKANMEYIMANKANLPTLNEVKETYKKRRNEWNNAPHYATGLPRMQMYMESTNPKAPAVDMWDMVDLFWIQRPKPVMASAYGITFQEKGQKYTYAVYTENGEPDVMWLSQHIDQKFTIKYDPSDMSMIYLYESTPLGLRFVTEARTKVEINRAIQDQAEGEKELFANIESSKVLVRKHYEDEMDKILEEHGALPEQNGYRSPKLVGMKSERKKAPNQIAKVQKVISNTDVDFNEEGGDIDMSIVADMM